MTAAAIALLGTSADPPTRGHQVLLEGLLNRYGHVATWASDNPLKQHDAPLELRAMLLGQLVQQLQDERLELAQHLSSPYTLITLQRAAQHWPDRELVFVVGSDLAGQIPRWKQSNCWLPQCRLAIAPRKGWPLEDATLQALRDLGGQVDLLDLEVPAIASSQLRLQPNQAQIPEAVWPLLLQHNLYGLSGSLC
ncbi:nicotinate (nicotinamide) nucleotide adenylyltransferase [Synechococcus sp. A15-62]|uniref:nicotinate-nucleotide adenylyltransferase n=1 Tax=Synechococcus sp. A15-62 TaxID=1050657 RepID=UPI00164655E7|nr:nicotinate-nucleotide adenylyltransferase [Synechococcus sp. A15-62]QNJ01145.1 nicotinate (nicotinamide) nucleotide adenylyltransferase [Synechococcus sp. A15-62]